MNSNLIAPCGMNCAICFGHIREKNKCPGCNLIKNEKSDYCRKCIIKNCTLLKENKMKFCSDKCDKYPCKRLKSLDKRYRTKYGMSMIENLYNIQKTGVKKFIDSEDKKWRCIKCGSILCVHRDLCLNCGEKRKINLI